MIMIKINTIKNPHFNKLHKSLTVLICILLLNTSLKSASVTVALLSHIQGITKSKSEKKIAGDHRFPRYSTGFIFRGKKKQLCCLLRRQKR